MPLLDLNLRPHGPLCQNAQLAVRFHENMVFRINVLSSKFNSKKYTAIYCHDYYNEWLFNFMFDNESCTHSVRPQID